VFLLISGLQYNFGGSTCGSNVFIVHFCHILFLFDCSIVDLQYIAYHWRPFCSSFYSYMARLEI
jgi:hypothetical protein